MAQKFGVPSPQNMAVQKPQNLGVISDTSRLDCDYLQTGRYRWLENGVANCNHSHTCL